MGALNQVPRAPKFARGHLLPCPAARGARQETTTDATGVKYQASLGLGAMALALARSVNVSKKNATDILAAFVVSVPQDQALATWAGFCTCARSKERGGGITTPGPRFQVT